jgi:hypothetical protein
MASTPEWHSGIASTKQITAMRLKVSKSRSFEVERLPA